MSVFSKLGKVFGKVAPLAAFAIPGVGPAVGSAIRIAAGLGTRAAAAAGPAVAAGVRTLPSVGRIAGTGLAGGAAFAVGERALGGGGQMVIDPRTGQMRFRRRRGRGFSSRDIRQTRRMLKLIKEMQSAIPRPRMHRYSK